MVGAHLHRASSRISGDASEADLGTTMVFEEWAKTCGLTTGRYAGSCRESTSAVQLSYLAVRGVRNIASF